MKKTFLYTFIFFILAYGLIGFAQSLPGELTIPYRFPSSANINKTHLNTNFDEIQLYESDLRDYVDSISAGSFSVGNSYNYTGTNTWAGTSTFNNTLTATRTLLLSGSSAFINFSGGAGFAPALIELDSDNSGSQASALGIKANLGSSSTDNPTFQYNTSDSWWEATRDGSTLEDIKGDTLRGANGVFSDDVSITDTLTSAILSIIGASTFSGASLFQRGVTLDDNVTLKSQITGTVTANATTDLLTLMSHGLVANNKVQFTTTTTLPAGLSLATDYYVISSGLTSDDFKVSTSQGGSTVDITDTGTGTHTVATVRPVVDFNQNTLIDLPDPVNAQDVATKNYVDTEIDYIKYLFIGNQDVTSGSAGSAVGYYELTPTGTGSLTIPADRFNMVGDVLYIMAIINATNGSGSSANARFFLAKSLYDTQSALGSNSLTGAPSVYQIPVATSGEIIGFEVWSRLEQEALSNIYTVDPSTDVFTATSHGYTNGDLVQFWSDPYNGVPIGISGEYTAALPYYIINATSNTFQVSTTMGGSSVNITSTGTGTHHVYRGGQTQVTVRLEQFDNGNGSGYISESCLQGCGASNTLSFDGDFGGGIDIWSYKDAAMLDLTLKELEAKILTAQ